MDVLREHALHADVQTPPLNLQERPPSENVSQVQFDDQQDNLVGVVLDARYRLDSVLGVGGMGTVYKGYHLRMEREVAVKVLAPHYSQNPQMIRRFKREGLVISKLSHPNIVTVFDYGESSEGLYLVMEYLQGLTLREFLDDRDRVAPSVIVGLIKQVVGALEHSHAVGIIHRDIKPANIFLIPNGDDVYSVKLLDFGVAKLKVPGDEHTMTQVSGVLGTPKYMAPEQARTAEVNMSVDLYSVGIILYEMLAGRVPFDGDHPLGILMDHQNKPVPSLDLSVDLKSHVGALPQIAFQCLEKKPHHRYESSGRLLEALQDWTDEPASVLFFGASPASESGGHSSSQNQQPRTGWSLVFSILAIAFISGALWFQSTNKGQSETENDSLKARKSPRMVEVKSTPSAKVIRLSDNKMLGVTPLQTPVDESERLSLQEQGFAPLEVILNESTPPVINFVLKKTDGQRNSVTRPQQRQKVERVRRSELEKNRLIKPKPQSDSKPSVGASQSKEDVSENPLELE